MNYKKFVPSFLFDGYRLHNYKALITDDKGIVQSVVSKEEINDDKIELQGILCPGFINCHCHLELSHMHGLIPEQTGLVDFIFSIVTKRNFNEEQILEAIAKGEEEMIQNGIVAVGDISNNAITFSQKQKGNLAYYNFIEVSGWSPDIAQTRFDNALTTYELFGQLPTANYHSSTAFVPHAPYSVSEKLWGLLQPFFQNKTISIHNQETSFEDDFFVEGNGDFTRMYNLLSVDTSFFSPSKKSSLQTYFSKLKNARNVMLVHNTFTKERDVLYAKNQAEINKQNLFWCLCINANLYIENAVPPVEMLLRNNCNLVLGTDSLASNRSLNLLDEIKSLKHYFPFLSTEQLLQFATSNGAKALRMDDVLGSFEPGKKPGILLVSEKLSEVKRLL